MSTQECRVSEEEVLAYAAGELEEGEELRLAEHIGWCGLCRDQAAEFTALTGALSDACTAGGIRWHAFESPFGTMYVAATDRGLARVSWQQPGPEAWVGYLERRFRGQPVVRDPDALREAETQLLEYFAGERTRFDLPVDLAALTPFERRVLEEASTISFGQVVPYSELARRIGRPTAARAVGNALGHNPVAIVVPCHRVVRTDGSLGGYGGGVHWKERLLELEGRADRLRAG